MKKILNILKYTAITILSILALIFVSVFIQTRINHDKVPNIFGYKPFIVLSGSMETELHKGDLVVVKNTNLKSLKKGDIIAFKDESNHIVTHRIVEVIEKSGNKKFITKGDNNNKNDLGSVKMENIEGKYSFKISKFGNVLLILKKPITLFILLLIIIGLGIIWILLGNNKLSIDERKELELLRKKTKKKLVRGGKK